MEKIWLILILSVMGPVIGSFIGVLRRPSKKVMYHMLSFAAGVMLAISFLELIPRSIALSSVFVCSAGIITGTVVMFALDKILPHIHPELCSNGDSLEKTSLYLIIGIFLHNFPEGMAIGIGTFANAGSGLMMALAIAVHNIPEGICTSAPYFFCTKKRLRSFLVSSTTAIPILMGFAISHFLLRSIPSEVVGFIIGSTAGFMIYITGHELIPCSCGTKNSSCTIQTLILGIIFVILLSSI